MVIEYTLASSARKFVSTGNVVFPLVRAFMDDLNRMSSSVSGTQNLLHRCVKALPWAGQVCISELTSLAILLLLEVNL